MKKIVTIIYTGDDWHLKILFPDSPYTRKAFEGWHEKGLKENVEFYRSSVEWYNEKKNVFIKGWAYRDKKWLKIKKPIKPDLVFDKVAGRYDYELFDWKIKLAKKIKLFNHPFFRTLYDNKMNQAAIFKDFMPITILVQNRDELGNAIKKMKGQKIVVKPPYGSGGFGIFIAEKNKIKKQKFEFPILVQEFIKSEKGIPGFSKQKECADLRLTFLNHKLIFALSRIAKRDSLFTNFHQGAKPVLVPNNKIPKSALRLAGKIIKMLEIFPETHYSLDFMFDNKGRPFLIEMNTTPGFDLLNIVGSGKLEDDFFKRFIKIIP